jgi:hypothetical protein
MSRRFGTLELFRGLAQRTKGRKTSYLDAVFAPCGAWKTTLAPAIRVRILRSEIADLRGGRPTYFPRIKDGNETILRSRRNQPETIGGYIGNQQTARRRLEAHMNHSIHSADRATHLKIVVMALVAGIAVAGFAISTRSGADYSQSARVIKAGKPVMVTTSDSSVVR